MGILYFFITFFATLIGGLTGIGGGIIIKPLLDLMGDFPLETISLLSCFSVFTMALINTYKNRKYIKELDQNLLIKLAIYSFLGGIVGNVLLNGLLEIDLISEKLVGDIQSLLLIIMVVVVMYLSRNKDKFNVPKMDGNFFIFIIGTFLGILSSFLSIGGGPLNVIVLILFWKMSQKDASIGSITIILFAQISVIIQTIAFSSLADYDLSMLIYMIPGAIIGGFLGSKLIHIFKEYTLIVLNTAVMIFIIVINIYNIVG